MKISEKQLMALFSIATQAASMADGAVFDREAKAEFSRFLDCIINQQSNELKEIKDEA